MFAVPVHYAILLAAVRSMALSGRHGVLALRSSDGVELRSVRRAEAGRWLHGFRDRWEGADPCFLGGAWWL